MACRGTRWFLSSVLPSPRLSRLHTPMTPGEISQRVARSVVGMLTPSGARSTLKYKTRCPADTVLGFGSRSVRKGSQVRLNVIDRAHRPVGSEPAAESGRDLLRVAQRRIGQEVTRMAEGPDLPTRNAFIEFAMKSRLPAVYGFRELVPEGALMSLSADLSDIAARGPLYVDKILKGAKPGDLPIALPTKFALVHLF